MLRYLLLTVFVFVSAACANLHVYDGPTPNLELQGEEAKKEVEKFTLKENVAYYAFENQKSEIMYTPKSMHSLVTGVSESAAMNLQEVEKWKRWQLYALSVGVVGFVAGLLAESDSSERSTLMYTSIAGSLTSIGLGSYAASVQVATPTLYNEDLRRRLLINVGYNVQF